MSLGSARGFGGRQPMLPPNLPPRMPKPPRQRRSRGRGIWFRLFGFLFAAGMFVFLVGAALVGYFLWDLTRELPDYEVLAKYEPPVMTRVHANDGNLIAEYAHERRIYVPMNAVPKVIINAFLAAEDKNFFQHGGIDFKGIARAVVTNINNYRNNRRFVGASTITQQVAKNFLLTNERSLERKIKEAVLAIRIERAFTKHQILELYLNEIYLGFYSYGIAAAALNYFGKSLKEITIEEAAYLAALPKGPNNYHPFRKRAKAIERRNWVIGRMASNGYITTEQAKNAIASPFIIRPRPFGAHMLAGEFFAEQVRRTILKQFGEQKTYGGGLSVRSTLDPKLQRLAKKALVKGLVNFDQAHGWRGSVSTIDLSQNRDWGPQLAKIEALQDVQPWRLAVVTGFEKSTALIGLQPKTLPSGKVEKTRETGTIAVANMKWARLKKGETKRGDAILGKSVNRASDILNVGDVIYVSPIKPNDNKTTNDQTKPKSWQLMQVPEVEGAIVVMDPHTGRVKALVGGFSFDDSQFDRATQAKRQPGSSFKPFVYAAALDNGYTPSTLVLDAPIAIDQGGTQGIWKPKNYSGNFNGPSTLRVGIEKSRNLMTVRLAQDMGMPLITEYSRRFGIYENLLPVLSMSLGAGETTLLRLTSAYAMLANGGKKIEPTLIDRIQDRYGKTVWSHDKRKCEGCTNDSWRGQAEPQLIDYRRQIIDPHTAYQITSMLEGVVLRGTARRALNGMVYPLAGKTGTTNESRDAWFVGFSPDMVVGVFVGYDVPRPLGAKATGGGLAAPIFRDFMESALKNKTAVPFRVPPGIQLIPIDVRTGLRADGGERTILEAFKPGNQPPDEVSIIYDDPSIFIPETDRALEEGVY